MDLGSSALQRWISTLPSSEMSFQFNRLKLLDLDFERIKGRLSTQGEAVSLDDVDGQLAGGQLAVEGRLDGSGLFSVVGGVDEADSGKVLTSLGFEEEIIEGPLFMQFGVEGRLVGTQAGRHHGNIEMMVDKGIIRKFPVLSSILSFLNLSQILTGHAPELSSEGMIFRKLRGSFFLEKGSRTFSG